MDCILNSNIIANRLQEAELYTRKFGTFAKSDFEILMFSIYLESLKKEPRDYEISCELGITESKVRNLRVKAQLLYPREISWKNELEKALSRARFNRDSCTITVTIEDPSVQNLLKDKIERMYDGVGITLNPKQLVLPVETYVLLASDVDGNSEEMLRKLNEVYRKETGDALKITKESLMKRMWSKTSDINTMLSIVASAVTIWPSAAAMLEKIQGLLRLPVI